MICSLSFENRSITIDAELFIDEVTRSYRLEVFPFIQGRKSDNFNPEDYISRNHLIAMIIERFTFFQHVLDLKARQAGINAFQLEHGLAKHISKQRLQLSEIEKEKLVSIPTELHAYNGYLQGALSYCLLKLGNEASGIDGLSGMELVSALSGSNRPNLQQVEFWNNLDVFDSSLSKPSLTDFSFLDRIINTTGTPALLFHFPANVLEDYLRIVFYPLELSDHQKAALRTWFQSSSAQQFIRPMDIANQNLAFLILSTLHLSGLGKKEHWILPDQRILSLPGGFQNQKNHWLVKAFLLNGNPLNVKAVENLSKQFYKHNDQLLIDVKEIRKRLQSFISDQMA
ncbi:MAG TPA: hypothetical protein PK798_04285 [Flavobacteriales bacterium]|nr:hypothetical protein [Flavobacteriales bacterium]HRJ37982.1 hypothetical protein [Flavobacteriales bacterium]